MSDVHYIDDRRRKFMSDENFLQNPNDDMSQSIYSIGVVSKMLNIHPQTIRYFGALGTIVPRRDEKTGERKYSIYDIYKLMLRKQYQNVGFSVKDLENLLNLYSLEDVIHTFELEKEKLEKEKWELELRQKGLASLLTRSKSIKSHKDRVFYAERPAFWQHAHMRGKKLLMDENSLKARKIAVKLMPLSFYSFCINMGEVKDDILEEDLSIFDWNLGLEDELSKIVGYNEISGSEYIPREMCLYSIFAVEGMTFLTSSMLNPIWKFMKYNNFSVNGNIHGRLILSSTNKRKNTERFFEVWVPFKNRHI